MSTEGGGVTSALRNTVDPVFWRRSVILACPLFLFPLGKAGNAVYAFSRTLGPFHNNAPQHPCKPNCVHSKLSKLVRKCLSHPSASTVMQFPEQQSRDSSSQKESRGRGGCSYSDFIVTCTGLHDGNGNPTGKCCFRLWQGCLQ